MYKKMSLVPNYYPKSTMLAGFTTLILTGGINSVHGTLSATTNINIQGSMPYFILSDGITKLTTPSELLGFTMTYTNSETGQIDISRFDTTMATTPTQSRTIIAPTGMKFNDIKTLIPLDNTPYELSTLQLTVGDDDGDASSSDIISYQGTMQAAWYDKRGVMITDLDQLLSPCESPYTLLINTSNVSANTAYGNPSLNLFGSNNARYIFKVEQHQICFVRPLNMTVLTTSTSSSSGFNPQVFDTTLGFNITALEKKNQTFPSTGFRGAKFTLLGSDEDQTNYRCALVNDTDAVSLSGTSGRYQGQNCTLRYESETRFTTPITIQMEHKNSDGTWQQVDSYTIPEPTHWAIRGGAMAYANNDILADATSFPALSKCSGENVDSINHPVYINRQKYLFRRNELTNSIGSDPTTYPENSAPTTTNAQFIRDADGTFMGEWGLTYKYDYASYDQLIFFWTSEAYSSNRQFEVGTSGNVANMSPTSVYNLVECRG
ncbi:hypothetical protein DES39_1611 [Orbus hercynius]|uniref:Uncharacterized protein n=1 Tax=Orbus hercynius TaxID=593135 RepID=A0A495RCA0_9GAMM|nr:hypothetical protein [Orbus hercynius]RKS85102.1 hypothetical protein DES39_1611 [Orbus hercynius]